MRAFEAAAAAAAPRAGAAAGAARRCRGPAKLKGAPELRAKYQHAACFGDAGRPPIDFASVSAFAAMNWTSKDAMTKDIRERLGTKKCVHAAEFCTAALDILAMPVNGENFFENKDFRGAIEFWCRWTAPESKKPNSDLHGKHHFFATKYYPTLYNESRESWVRHDGGDLHEYCKNQVGRRMRSIKFFNEQCGFGCTFIPK